MDYELEQYYKNKVNNLEKENRELRQEYQSEHKIQENMARQIASQKRIIEKRNMVIKKYIDRYGILEED